MRVGVFAICYNEEALLPYFFRHYRQFADVITIIDNKSTDGSRAICEKESDIVETLDSGDKSNIDILTKLKNTHWKKYKDCDWFFIVDVDEIIYHPDMRNFLAAAADVHYNVLQPFAYQMVCEQFPIGNGQITEIMPYGVRSTPEICEAFFACPSFDKKSVIAPSQIVETNYGYGMHKANIQGNINELRDPSLKLLHYRMLGLDYFLGKNRLRSKRLIKELVEKGSSVHYLKTEEEITPIFNDILANCEDVVKGETSP